jgi:hypothetical protein
VDAHPYPYAHLAPELRRLTGDALLLWADTAERTRELAAVVAAWDHGSAATLDEAVRRVDDAVVSGLAALGLPRGPGWSVQVDRFGRGWIGHVADDGTIRFDVDWLRHYLAVGRSDRPFCSWVHESLHARGPAVPVPPTRHVEYPAWPGYEEGLADGLARVATATKAGLPEEASAYDYFVEAYRALGRVADVDTERLWRALWRHPQGAVRTNFAPTLGHARRACSSAPLAPRQRSRLMAVADRVFAAGHQRDRPDPATLLRLWETVFR